MLNTKTIKVSLPRIAFKSEDRFRSFKGKEKVVVTSSNTVKIADFYEATANLVSAILNSIDDRIFNRLHLFTVSLLRKTLIRIKRANRPDISNNRIWIMNLSNMSLH